jgi:hypothetical protein
MVIPALQPMIMYFNQNLHRNELDSQSTGVQSLNNSATGRSPRRRNARTHPVASWYDHR